MARAELESLMSTINIPKDGDLVFKDECTYSFDSPDSDEGLYVCMNTWLGLARHHLEGYSKRTGHRLFLHRLWNKMLSKEPKEAEPEKKIAKLAIGIEGGFPAEEKKKHSYFMALRVIVMPDFYVFDLPDVTLPKQLRDAAAAIEIAVSAVNMTPSAPTDPWDGEERKVTKYSTNLEQIENGVKIPPKCWQCSKCSLTENLWLNLTDGEICCGRRQLDGSGGNNHALDHYQATNYPLAVKLGTITPNGKADVYSYAEDDMVVDANLLMHLRHFGIAVASCEKTEKTIAELEIDMNQRSWEYSRCTESSEKLVPIFGPGYTGLHNLGNTCYLNSVIQILFSMPAFIERYYNNAEELMFSIEPKKVHQNFDAQFSKLAVGLLSGRYSQAPADYDPAKPENVCYEDLEYGVSPALFRKIVGEGHAEFRTKKQQDAVEYLEHIVKFIERDCQKTGRKNPCHPFKFGVSDKFICTVTGCARYVHRTDLYIPLPVLLDEANNRDEVEAYIKRRKEAEKNDQKFEGEVVRSSISFESCMSKILSTETITAFSTAANAKVDMKRTTRMTSFPDYLFIQLVKFGITQEWEPIKYDVSVDMPDILDMTAVRREPSPEGEKLMPESEDKEDKCAPEIPKLDDAVVKQLQEMGFPLEGCKKAVHMTGNVGLDVATNWIMEHMSDPDFDQPLVISSDSQESGAAAAAAAAVDPQSLTMLECMGFSSDQAKLGLKKTSNNLERAADWLFSHQSELEQLLVDDKAEPTTNTKTEQKKSKTTEARTDYTDGGPTYELSGIISHMGTSVHVGHYVCHIKKEGQWVIYNDTKVSKSVNPPLDLGYLYLYKRIDS